MPLRSKLKVAALVLLAIVVAVVARPTAPAPADKRVSVDNLTRLRTIVSPITHAARVTTPLLIQHGDRDPRVPLATAQKVFRALTVLGKTVEMDIYPGGGHETAQERTVMLRNFEWFRRWIP